MKVDTKYLRNIANHGRGSEMTKALHDACDYIDTLTAALAPFSHPDLCKVTGGNVQGDESPVYGRDGALLLLGDFRRAASVISNAKGDE